MKRSEFRFRFDAKKLQEAAQTKADYHREREQHYLEDAERREAELREKGVDLREQQVTGGTQFQIVADPALLRMYEAARAKQKGHNSQAEQYESWSRAFELACKNQHDREWFDLDIDDVTYFGL